MATNIVPPKDGRVGGVGRGGLRFEQDVSHFSCFIGLMKSRAVRGHRRVLQLPDYLCAHVWVSGRGCMPVRISPPNHELNTKIKNVNSKKKDNCYMRSR